MGIQAGTKPNGRRPSPLQLSPSGRLGKARLAEGQISYSLEEAGRGKIYLQQRRRRHSAKNARIAAKVRNGLKEMRRSVRFHSANFRGVRALTHRSEYRMIKAGGNNGTSS